MKKLLIILVLILPIPSIGLSVTTWDSGHMNAHLALSGTNNLTVNTTSPYSGGWVSVRANISKAAGKWQWEITPQVTAGTGDFLIGAANSSFGFGDGSFTGTDAYSWGYYNNDGKQYHSGSGSACGATYNVTATVITVTWDADGHSLTLYKNGASQCSISITDTLFPVLSLYSGNGATVQATANFGATTFAYPQSGFSGFDTSSTPNNSSNFFLLVK